MKLSDQHSGVESNDRQEHDENGMNDPPAEQPKQEKKKNKKKRVRFEDYSNDRVIHIGRIPEHFKEDLWYGDWDYVLFRMQFWSPNGSMMQHGKNHFDFLSSFLHRTKAQFWPAKESEQSNNSNDNSNHVMTTAMMHLPGKERKFLTFGPHAQESRHYLVETIIRHQEECRAVGYSDPQGLYLISKALSKSDRKLAWELAMFNAEEVACFNILDAQEEARAAAVAARSSDKGESGGTLFALLFGCYLDTLYPLLNDPLEFVSDVLCKIDD